MCPLSSAVPWSGLVSFQSTHTFAPAYINQFHIVFVYWFLYHFESPPKDPQRFISNSCQETQFPSADLSEHTFRTHYAIPIFYTHQSIKPVCWEHSHSINWINILFEKSLRFIKAIIVYLMSRSARNRISWSGEDVPRINVTYHQQNALPHCGEETLITEIKFQAHSMDAITLCIHVYSWRTRGRYLIKLCCHVKVLSWYSVNGYCIACIFSGTSHFEGYFPAAKAAQKTLKSYRNSFGLI